MRKISRNSVGESEKLFVGEKHSAKLSEGGKGKKEA